MNPTNYINTLQHFIQQLSDYIPHTHTHTRTHKRTHARARIHTHTHTHRHTYTRETNGTQMYAYTHTGKEFIVQRKKMGLEGRFR